MTTIKVAEVEVKEGKSERGPWKRFAVVDGNGAQYQTFDHDIGNAAKTLVGKQADIEWEEQERNGYKNKVLTSIKEHVEEPKAQGNGFYRATDPVDARRMTRSAAAERAVDFFALGKQAERPRIEDVLSIADQIAAWVLEEGVTTSSPSRESQREGAVTTSPERVPASNGPAPQRGGLLAQTANLFNKVGHDRAIDLIKGVIGDFKPLAHMTKEELETTFEVLKGATEIPA